MAHEFGNFYTGNILSAGWPCDWWADHGACPSVPGVESPAPASFANVALQQINWQSSAQVSQDVDNENKNDVLFVMFRDKLIGKYGIGMFKTAFNAARQDLMDWTKIDSGKNPSGLLTNYVAAYLTIGANTDLSPIFNNYANQPYPSGMTGFDGKVMNDIIAARNLIYNATYQGKDVTAAWNAYRTGKYQDVKNLIVTTTTTATTTTTIPSRCAWGISYSPASGAGNGLIPKGSKIRVSHLPKETEYYDAGGTVYSPNKYFELGFLAWDANQLKAKVYFGKNVAGTINGILKDNISIPSIGKISLGSVFPNNGLMTNTYYSNLKNSTFVWKGSDYDYHEQVDISTVSMSRDPYVDKINGTAKMVVGTNAAIEYEYVFDKDLNFGGSITNPEYMYPVKIKLMDKDFSIVGVGTSSIKVLQGSMGIATATTSVDYGSYKFYATIGSPKSMQIDVKDAAGNTVETILFTGIASGTAATKITTKTSPLLDVTITSFEVLTDGRVISCNLVVGPAGTTVHEYDGIADVTSSSPQANDCFSETPQVQTCTDSDGGLNYYVKGTCTSCNIQGGFCSAMIDTCSAKTLTECYCEGNNIASINNLCPNGCNDGACISGNPKIDSFACSEISGYLKAQCSLSISGLDSTKKYFVYVAGNLKDFDQPASGATIISGSDSPVTVIVLSLYPGTYQLGAWVFEGTNPDVIKPSLTFWAGSPVEVQMSQFPPSPITTITIKPITTTLKERP